MAIDLNNWALSHLRWFGETITVVLADATERELVHDPDNGTYGAFVERSLASPIPEVPGIIRPVATVWVRNDDTLGISADELDTATFSLKFPRRVGGSVETFKIHRIREQDEGLLALEVR